MSRRIPGQPGKFICWFRRTLLGRPLEPWPWARPTSAVSPRCPPGLPNLPSGPAHKLNDNYYLSRDLRCKVAPPTVVGSHKQLKEAEEQLSSDEVVFPQNTTPPTPGSAHSWTSL